MDRHGHRDVRNPETLDAISRAPGKTVGRFFGKMEDGESISTRFDEQARDFLSLFSV